MPNVQVKGHIAQKLLSAHTQVTQPTKYSIRTTKVVGNYFCKPQCRLQHPLPFLPTVPRHTCRVGRFKLGWF